MKKLFTAILALTATISITACDQKTGSTGVDAAQKKEIEKIVHEYIVNNPEVLIEAGRNLQKRQQPNPQEEAKLVLKNAKRLFEDAESPVAGNLSSKNTIVEFFDYNCGYCHKVLPDLKKVLANDKDVRVIFKELPVLGPSSEFAALAALAANDLDKKKYFVFHAELLGHRGQKDEAAVRAAAGKAGLNADTILEKMNDDKFKKHLADNQSLAQELGIGGTPSFIINGQIIRGAIGYDVMSKVLNDRRQK